MKHSLDPSPAADASSPDANPELAQPPDTDASSSAEADARSAARRMRRFRLAIGAVLWIAALGAVFVTIRKARERTPATAPGVEAKDDHRAPSRTSTASGSNRLWDPQGIEDFALTERSGRVVTRQDLLGRPWVVAFIFTRCAGPCPRITGQMKLLQDRFADTPLQLVTITVDPKRDTPEVLRQYADAFGADPEKWWFLTGSQEDVYRLISRSFRMIVHEWTGEKRKPGYEVMHTRNILLVDAKGVVLGKYDAIDDAQMAALRRAISRELAELPNAAVGEQTSPAADN